MNPIHSSHGFSIRKRFPNVFNVTKLGLKCVHVHEMDCSCNFLEQNSQGLKNKPVCVHEILSVWKSGTGPGLLPETGWVHPKSKSRRLSEESYRQGMGKRMEISALNPEGFQGLWGCGFGGSGVCQRTGRCAIFKLAVLELQFLVQLSLLESLKLK